MQKIFLKSLGLGLLLGLVHLHQYENFWGLILNELTRLSNYHFQMWILMPIKMSIGISNLWGGWQKLRYVKQSIAYFFSVVSRMFPLHSHPLRHILCNFTWRLLLICSPQAKIKNICDTGDQTVMKMHKIKIVYQKQVSFSVITSKV